MRYEFKPITKLDCGEVCRITGFQSSADRVKANDNPTNFKGTMVLFSEHICQYTKREKKPTTDPIRDLLFEYNRLNDK